MKDKLKELNKESVENFGDFIDNFRKKYSDLETQIVLDHIGKFAEREQNDSKKRQILGH